MGAVGGVCLGVVLGGGQTLMSGGGAKTALRNAGMAGAGERGSLLRFIVSNAKQSATGTTLGFFLTIGAVMRGCFGAQ